MASTVEITVGGTDVTANAMWKGTSFDEQQNAAPGTFNLTLKDPDSTLGPFNTGDEVIYWIGGQRRFGGYAMQVSSTFAFPADKVPTQNRIWVIRGVDYNILFDRRISRNPISATTSLPAFHGDDYDGDLIKLLCSTYVDLPAGMDTTTYVDNVLQPFAPAQRGDASAVGAWKQPGSTWRDQMELISQFSSAVYYIDPSMNLHYHSLENATAPFGFSDNPNGATTVGMRDVTATEDGAGLANEAHVWGGSEWTEGVVYGNAENATSITEHGLWEVAEHHFGETSYLLDTDWRAELLVEGSPAITGFDPGLAYPQWNVQLSWFDKDEPSGLHIRAGQLVSVDLSSFGGPLSPIVLPMRSISVSFVGLDAGGDGHVQFSGQLGLQLGDSTSLWGYLRQRSVPNIPVAAASNATTSSTYGSFGQFTPELVSGLVYQLPNDLGYISGTLQIYDNGALLSRNTDYTETDPVAGTFTLTGSPAGWLWVVCRTT